jgi:hypothetical protein
MSFLGGRPNVVNPGTYRLVLTVDGVELSQPIRVEADPTQSGPIITSGGDEDEDLDP